MFYMTASRVHAHFMHSHLVESFCPLKLLPLSGWCSSIHYLDHQKWGRSSCSWVPLFAEQLPKNPISNMLHSIKCFAGQSSGWDISSSGWEEAVSLWPKCSGITTCLCCWYCRLASHTLSEIQILWSNNVMQTWWCGLQLVCAAA